MSYSVFESFLFLRTKADQQKLQTELANKTILITGASSGIGKETAYLLKEVDCHLILAARRGDLLFEIKNEIETYSASVTIFEGDLREVNVLDRLIDLLHSLPHRIDVVVNNAGLSIRRSIVDSLDRYHDFSRTMAINYFVPVKLLLSIIPLLKERRGHIINVSTVNAKLSPVPSFAAYQSSKTAFDTWLRSSAPELESVGVVVTSIYLPLVKTPMIAPTKAYTKAPAMKPEHAAAILCKTLYTKQRTYQPWWLFFGQVWSLFTRSLPDPSKNKEKGDYR